MTIDYSEKGKIKFIMNDYVENLLDEVPDNLFTVNDKAEKISDEDSKKYHRLTAKLLYLSKRVRAQIFKPLCHSCASELSNQTSTIGKSLDSAYVTCEEPKNLSSRWNLMGLA
jgi:hypothetical protein